MVETPAENSGGEVGGTAIELVFAFIGPTGVDLDLACDALIEQLKAVGYSSQIVRSRDIISLIGPEPSRECDRIEAYMNAGNDLREANNDSIVALRAIGRIRGIRKSITNDEELPAPRVAYIVRSLKRKEEVQLLRQVYGKAFTLISVYATHSARLKVLESRFKSDGMTSTDASEAALRIVNRDHMEEAKLHGQRVVDTFPLADFFATAETRAVVEKQFRRLTRLIFGDPYISPNRNEQGMFFAQAAALRSLDLSRQVGAAVLSDRGDVLATGCNDVPTFGGGLYWADDDEPMRDYEWGYDSNSAIKTEIVVDTFRRLRGDDWTNEKYSELSNETLARNSLFNDDGVLKRSPLSDLIEFGRAVHAEMDCITQAARLGVPLKGARLFSTTFPCHLCARHIVAAGIEEVFFIEPYEKSRTATLYGDSIVVEPSERSNKRVNFNSFVGVAPRRYMSYFLNRTGRKTKDGQTLASGEITAKPRLQRIVMTYIRAEEYVISEANQKDE